MTANRLFSLLPSFRKLYKLSSYLRICLARTGGRNTAGRISAFRVGSNKFRRLVNFVDFWRHVPENGFVVRIIKDSFRTVYLSLVLCQSGFLTYLSLPETCKIGDFLFFKKRASLRSNPLNDTSVLLEHNVKKTKLNSFVRTLGNSLPLKRITLGAFVFNVELWPFKGAQLCRAAGTYAIVLARRKKSAILKLRSGWRVVVSKSCYATLGIASNAGHKYFITGKAGRASNLGHRFSVRGVAMNAIDHPHGGGRGKTSGGPQPRSPWGKITKNQATVKNSVRVRNILKRFRFTNLAH